MTNKPITEEALAYVSEEKEVHSPEEAIAGAMDIIWAVQILDSYQSFGSQNGLLQFVGQHALFFNRSNDLFFSFFQSSEVSKTFIQSTKLLIV